MKFRAISAAIALVALLIASPEAAAAATFNVGPGQSIQAAIDAAPAGSTIKVAPGTYHENLEINKNNISLVGAGASSTILLPPAQPLQRFCTPDPNDPIVAGICFTGLFDFDTAQVIKPLLGARLSGFGVQDFPGVGIVIVGVEGAVIERNSARGNGARGILAINSSAGRYSGNDANGNTGAGIQIQSFGGPEAGVQITKNTASDNTEAGIFVGDASRGVISGNVTQGNCVGIALVDFSGTGARRWAITGNRVQANNCPTGVTGPFSGIGIDVVGGKEIAILGNRVLDNVPNGPSFSEGGIRIEDGAPAGGSEPRAVAVTGNTVRRNEPVDLSWDGSGTDIAFKGNRCATSNHPGLC